MPRGDRTGPDGQGPQTGRARGYCSGFDSPGYMSGSGGWGFGRQGRGFGRRFFGGGTRQGYWSTAANRSEYSSNPGMDQLAERTDRIEQVMTGLQNQIQDLLKKLGSDK